MSITPIITFKAGICDIDSSSKPYKVKPSPRPGYIYLYSEDDLIHFCWRERNVPLDEPELDLVMVPTDGHFIPYDSNNQPQESAKTNGRIFVLKFLSSSQRHLFWLQSKPQGRSGDPTWLSPRDRKIGEIVDKLLQGEEVDVVRELASITNHDNDDRHGGDHDEPMEDVEGNGDPSSQGGGGSGGAGAGATGGDVREEGESAREGGADGARAAAAGVPDAATAVRNFLDSLRGNDAAGGGAGQAEGKLYPLLSDLLTPPTTVPMARGATEEQVDNLLGFLPPSVLVLSQQADQGDSAAEPTADAIEAAKQAMSLGQKKALLEKVLRSPQFHQSLTSLTMALRDGGLPTVADALAIKVENGGYMRGGQMPLGGGDAVEAFVEGVRKTVQENE
ncbi:proteasome complex subunit Rpn13 ubiquitin receptor-domain-containing protein [Xylariaceae sp. FL0662B]|nr:proteasome complex subunit Rpn13 ubiquitin receptor-domain-containing protein [Xylariaceae sp. FL0662B]